MRVKKKQQKQWGFKVHFNFWTHNTQDDFLKFFNTRLISTFCIYYLLFIIDKFLKYKLDS